MITEITQDLVKASRTAVEIFENLKTKSMDDSKHTVTLPIAQYNELMRAEEQLELERHNLEEHLKFLLNHGGFMLKLDLSKLPKRLSVTNTEYFAHNKQVMSIKFEYT